MIGGAQGSGVDSSANMFARACNFGGLFVFGKREYYSNIMGEHSYFQVRVAERPVRSHLDNVHLLATFDNETLVRHAREVSADGGVIYDSTGGKIPLSEIPTLEKRILAELRSQLREAGVGETTGDVLELARRNGVHLYPLPYTELLKKVAEHYGETKLSKLSKMVNTMAVAASFALLDYEEGVLPDSIRATFRTKPKIAEMNVYAAQMATDYVRSHYRSSFPFKLKPVAMHDERIYLQGNQAIALGKLLAGCRFQTYYPITPASDESVYLEDHETFTVSHGALIDNPQLEEVRALRENGGSIVVVQSEDEIAALGMATGAGLAGARASTSTSGPGFSLMCEAMGWAGMNEVPVVITLYQRAGPSTGLPTRHEQGDLRFVVHAGHGEFPRIVLASGDLEECFYDAVRAFNYAERYQLPVVHIVDKAMANSNATYPIFDTDGRAPKIDRGFTIREADVPKFSMPDGIYRRFGPSETGISPRVLLGTKGGTFWNTGDEHDDVGHITEDPVIRVEMMEKRMRKLDTAAREIPTGDKLTVHGDPDADLTIVSWGSTKGAILDAMDGVREEGHRVNFLQLRLLNPFPTDQVAEVLQRSRRRLAVEMNYSAQLAGMVREHTGYAMDNFVVKYNGRPMSMDEVYDSVKRVLAGEAPRRLVLTHGA
jgi:2-oxoglutarate ferredoxin oxidoreductase subunit alpha